MIITFESEPNHDTVHINPKHIVCIISNKIITDANAWTLEISSKDFARVLDEFKNELEQ